MKDINLSNDPLTLEELTQRVFELTERVAKLETLIEQHQKTFESIDRRFEKLEAKLDRFFWLWVSTVAAGIALRVIGLL